jgi:tripartite-type tricarboxylate transporter receptor subunit TctC
LKQENIMKSGMLSVSLGALLAASFLLPVAANAQQDWPKGPIKVYGPGAPGGPSALLARIVGDSISESIGQPVVFENKPGPGGVPPGIATLAAAADGYTFLFTTAATHGILPAVRVKPPFDVIKDFAPIAKVVDVPQLLYVNKNLPVKTVGELIAYAKANPGKLNFSSLGQGTSTHLSSVLLMTRSGINMLHIPFKGSAPALTAVVSGEVQVGMDLLPGTIAQAQSGNIRPLAVTTLVRSPELPDVPTVAESGLPGFEVSSWYGYVAKAGTPKPIIDRMAAEIDKALKNPAVVSRLRQFGAIPTFMPPDRFATYIAAEVDKWPPVVKASGFKPEE